MNYQFHPEAEAEFADAVSYYDAAEDGLGDDLEQEVAAVVARILRNPNSWPKYSNRTRRCLCNRFPYSIIYRVKDDEIVIYAVMHQKRKPGYWKDRLK
ncbi:MAG: type II toxin-antitoxin system RelE/ParE family toxin [Blastocatellia bacterium]|nr:type II toxin-antitoxin system RelE/ParE family toxin [Blastocatellia bacterium]